MLLEKNTQKNVLRRPICCPVLTPADSLL